MTTLELLERTSDAYEATLTDAAGAGLGPMAVQNLRLTLYDELTGAIINGRDGSHALDVTLENDGTLVWHLGADDAVLVDPTLAYEVHIARFDFTYNGGQDTGRHEVRLRVKNLRKVA